MKKDVYEQGLIDCQRNLNKKLKKARQKVFEENAHLLELIEVTKRKISEKKGGGK